MIPNFNSYLNKIENKLRKTDTFTLSKDACKTFFREEKIPDADREVEKFIKALENEKNTKIKYKPTEKIFAFQSKFNLTSKELLKKYLEDCSNEPLEESQELFDEYPKMKEDLQLLEKEGYIRKFAVKDKKGNKLNRVILFGRNPNDPIELMNLSEEFKEFRDVKPEKNTSKETRPDGERNLDMPAPKKKLKVARSVTKSGATDTSIKNILHS